MYFIYAWELIDRSLKGYILSDVVTYTIQSVNQHWPQQGRHCMFHEKCWVNLLKKRLPRQQGCQRSKGLGEIQLDEMSCDSWYRELLRWWNGFIVTAEDNELYSISLRGHPTAVSIATLVTFKRSVRDRHYKEVELYSPAEVWTTVTCFSALNGFSSGKTQFTLLPTSHGDVFNMWLCNC